MSDARRGDDDVSNLLQSQNVTGAVATPSGDWIDLSDYEGDVAIVVNIGAITGSGTVNVQARVSAANTGASAADAADPRGTIAQPAAAKAVAVIFVNATNQANKFVGVAVTLTGITAAQTAVTLMGHKRAK